MRKHASSWGIKAILAMIIFSFILFFGYSRISEINRPSVRGGSNQQMVATVNRMAIPASEFRFYFDKALDGVRTRYQGSAVPDFMKQMIERSTMAQLIQRELLLQVADELGIVVTDEDLADAIRASQVALRGEFDPQFYANQYLPYFENRFGIKFEDMVRNDLRAAQVQSLFSVPETAAAATSETKDAPSKAAEGEPITRWSFEIVTLDVDKMIKDKAISSAGEAKDIARRLADNPTTGQWKQLAATYGGKLDKIDSVALAERRTKLPGYSFDQYQTIFSLSDDKPVIDTPISRSDNTIAVVRLIERVDVTENTPPEQDRFLQQWMQGMAARSKISTYLDDQDQAKK